MPVHFFEKMMKYIYTDGIELENSAVAKEMLKIGKAYGLGTRFYRICKNRVHGSSREPPPSTLDQAFTWLVGREWFSDLTVQIDDVIIPVHKVSSEYTPMNNNVLIG